MLNKFNQEFSLERNTLVREVKENIADKIQLEVGDSKEDLFIPQAKVMRWDNEVNLSVRRDNGARSFVERDEKIVCEGEKEDVVIYELDDIGEDGGLEIEIHLKEKPKSNRFDFTIQTKGLDFFYQPALTPEEIEQGASRPDNVVGSYAVYHKTGRNNVVGGKEYKTGKFCHIYRPHVTDADSNETWGELEIDEEAGILTVVVPQKFLATASYPVIVDPTFGYTSVGETSLALSGGDDGVPFGNSVSGVNGTLDSMSVALSNNLSNGSFTTRVNLSNSEIASNFENIFTASESKSITTTATFYTLSADGESLSDSDTLYLTYNVIYVFLENGPRLHYDSVESGGVGGVYPGGLSNWSSQDTRNYSIYATYTATPSFNPAIARRRLLAR
jgi:hypothetical protein